ncbi:MAG: crotonase/enoyl-CoA hydratase family protein [Betaproteobacteria bacterium]|nr:crotonase/enoyl-CoA hydratase family protein [Betaproteobacteria bacterium]
MIGSVTVERRGHVLSIGLDRVAKRNAIDVPMYESLSAALGTLERDPELRCGVLFAHGDHFTGGIDLPQWTRHFDEGRRPALPDGGMDPLGQEPERALTKPLVMAVQGYCFTIGIELLLAADIRIAADNTRFAQIEIKRGIFPIGGATTRFIQEAGWGNAMRWLLTGDEFDASEALRIGLVQQVVPAGTQADVAHAIAATIAEQAPLAVTETLVSARRCRVEGERAATARLLPELQRLLRTDDAREGMESFRSRRPGRFTGR